MIIRNLKENEYKKSAKVISASYSFAWTQEDELKNFVPEYCYGAFEDDDDTLMSIIYSVSLQSRFCKKYVPCGGCGMICTLPQYRKRGCVRALFTHVFEDMKRKGEIFSYLYPFSYDYYRKFGYEQFGTKRVLTFPIKSLSSIPMNCDALIFDSWEDYKVLNEIYNCYTEKVNAAFERTQTMWEKKAVCDPYKGNLHTYIWHNKNGEKKSYATFRLENILLTVLDMAYCDSEGLNGILGFLRQFEGRVRKIKFNNVSEDSPLQYVISEYNDSTGELSAWAMARIVDVRAALENACYPEKSGHFAIKVNDFLEFNNKIFDVNYSNYKCKITERVDGEYDLSVGIPLLTRILLGTDTFTSERLLYLDCEVKASLDDLLCVFSRRERYLNDSTI